MDAETARLHGDGAERARFDAKRGNAAKKARQRGMWAPFGTPPATDAGGKIALAL